MYTGRKFISWLIAVAINTVVLACHLITADIFRDIMLGVTTVFVIGNVASKYTPQKPTSGQGE